MFARHGKSQKGFSHRFVARNGYVETDMIAQGIGDPAPIVRGISLKRAGLPGDIADVVAFLASDASRWITGQVISANGGQLASATFLRNL